MNNFQDPQVRIAGLLYCFISFSDMHDVALFRYPAPNLWYGYSLFCSSILLTLSFSPRIWAGGGFCDKSIIFRFFFFFYSLGDIDDIFNFMPISPFPRARTIF